MHLPGSAPANKSFFLPKFDLGLLSASVGMGVSRGKNIHRFSSKTGVCASSYWLLQFWCFDENAFAGIT